MIKSVHSFDKMILGCRNFPFLFIFMWICSVLC